MSTNTTEINGRCVATSHELYGPHGEQIEASRGIAGKRTPGARSPTSRYAYSPLHPWPMFRRLGSTLTALHLPIRRARCWPNGPFAFTKSERPQCPPSKFANAYFCLSRRCDRSRASVRGKRPPENLVEIVVGEFFNTIWVEPTFECPFDRASEWPKMADCCPMRSARIRNARNQRVL
jgi:hypothetical protein